MKITKQELFEMIKKEALEIKKAVLNENVEKVDDPLEVNMNKHDSLSSASDSDKALTYKNTKKKEEKAGPSKEDGGDYDKADEKMNSQDNDQGHDEEIATAVEVEAGAEKSGEKTNPHIEGQAKGKFTSKTEGPKKDASGPFDAETFDGKMNKEDKDIDEGAKTYVDAGEKKGGNTHTSGQAKAKPFEEAPEVKDKEPIAMGVEINGSNIAESYTKSEFAKFITEEAKKLIKKEQLQEQLKKVDSELKDLI